MIKSVHAYHIYDLLKKDANFYYKIPKYQRAYTWSQYHWKALYDDLMENGNEYFIGSIICINTADDSIGYQCLEVVDGQQRLTTITLFLAALYSKFQKWEEIVKNDEDIYDDYRALKKSRLCRLERKWFNISAAIGRTQQCGLFLCYVVAWLGKRQKRK